MEEPEKGRSGFCVKILFKFPVDILILARIEKTQFFTDLIEMDMLLLKRELGTTNLFVYSNKYQYSFEEHDRIQSLYDRVFTMSGLQYKIIQYVEDQSQKKNNSIEISYEIIQMLE